MPSYDGLVKGLTLLSCGVGSGAAYRLYCQSLHRKYFALFTFLCFQVIRSLLLLAVVFWLPRSRNVYAWAWVITQPLIWLFYIFVALELYSRVLQNYKGLQTVGRWVFFIAVTLAILISGASMLPTLRNPHEQVQVIFYYALVARGIMFSLVLFILLILFFLSWYPITLSRNLVVHSIICTLFFISVSMGYLVRNVEGSAVTRAVNISHLVITVICMSSWMFLLSARGEGSRMMIRREWTPDEEKRLVDQLTAINSSLMRATQK